MKNCPECRKALRDEAKFCTGCGYKFPAEDNSLTCRTCQTPLRAGAKFCGNCGTKVEAADPRSEASSVTVTNSYIHWNILKGQLAVKIDEEDIAGYGRAVKGIDIQEGVKALLFIHGKLAGQLSSGHYPFENWDREIPAEDKPHLVHRFTNWLCGFLPESWQQKAESLGVTSSKKFPVSFVLIRTNEFPLVYNFAEVPTATLRCNVGLHMLCKIANINEFYVNDLLDKKFVGFEKIANRLNKEIATQMKYIFASVSPEQITPTPEIREMLLQRLQPVISEIYPSIQLTKILDVSAQNEALENFRSMAEDLYVSEKELEELTKRNDFLNRLQGAENEQELSRLKAEIAHGNAVTDVLQEQQESAARRDSMHDVAMRSVSNAHDLTLMRMDSNQETEKGKIAAELSAAKEKIYEEMSLTEDERDKFDLMLSAQKKLREARSGEEIAAAMHEFRKSGLMREQELEALEHQISHDARLRDLNDAQVLAMATMQNQIALDKQSLEWEIQIGNKKFQNQFDRLRIKDAYQEEKRDKEYDFTDQRREKDAAYTDSRRRSTIDLDHQEQISQLNVLQQAQAIRQQREEAEHKRQMEAEAAARAHALDAQRLAQEAEQAKLDAANEEKRIYAGMTFEQIMAANPNLTPHAAQALAKKYEAEAEAAKAQAAIVQNDKTAQMAVDQRDQMMTFMEKQMSMMRDVAMSGVNAGANHQQAMIDAKQTELERSRSDAAANNDRFVDGMKTTVQAVGSMGNRNNILFTKAQPAPQCVRCPKCNSAVAAGEAFCSECGESL